MASAREREMKKGLSLAFLLSLVFAVLFVFIALSIKQEWIHSFDRSVSQAVQSLESPGATRVMEVLSLIGTAKFVIGIMIAAMIILFFLLGHRRELLFFTAVALGAYLLSTLIKALVKRDRPDVHRIVEEAGYSFPSGHSMLAIALYGSLAYLLWKHTATWAGRAVLLAVSFVMIAGIGISRIYLGVHYPSDVLGGYAASACWLGLAIFFGGRWIKGVRGKGTGETS